MRNSDVFKIRANIDSAREQIKNKLEQIDENEQQLQRDCNHDLVLKFDTHHLHKVGKIYPCVCAACKKKIDIVEYARELDMTDFKDSSIIDLTDILVYEEVVDSLIDIVSCNINYYYDDKITQEEKAKVLKSIK